MVAVELAGGAASDAAAAADPLTGEAEGYMVITKRDVLVGVTLTGEGVGYAVIMNCDDADGFIVGVMDADGYTVIK